MLSFPRAKIPLVLLLFLVLHLTVLSRLRVAGAAPDVMLLLAIAAGVVGGPQLGALLGFAAGLTLDLFLETPLGLSALVFCLVGYAVGNIQGGVLRASWWIPVLTALANPSSDHVRAPVTWRWGMDAPPTGRDDEHGTRCPLRAWNCAACLPPACDRCYSRVCPCSSGPTVGVAT